MAARTATKSTKQIATEIEATDLAQRSEVVKLRAQGETFTAIGARLGVSRQRAHQLFGEEIALVQRERLATAGQAVDEMIEREMALIRFETAKLTATCLRCRGERLCRPHTSTEKRRPAVERGKIICPECRGSGVVP